MIPPNEDPAVLRIHADTEEHRRYKLTEKKPQLKYADTLSEAEHDALTAGIAARLPHVREALDALADSVQQRLPSGTEQKIKLFTGGDAEEEAPSWLEPTRRLHPLAAAKSQLLRAFFQFRNLFEDRAAPALDCATAADKLQALVSAAEAMRRAVRGDTKKRAIAPEEDQCAPLLAALSTQIESLRETFCAHTGIDPHAMGGRRT